MSEDDDALAFESSVSISNRELKTEIFLLGGECAVNGEIFFCLCPFPTPFLPSTKINSDFLHKPVLLFRFNSGTVAQCKLPDKSKTVAGGRLSEAVFKLYQYLSYGTVDKPPFTHKLKGPSFIIPPCGSDLREAFGPDTPTLKPAT
jgi:hypothetical protein